MEKCPEMNSEAIAARDGGKVSSLNAMTLAMMRTLVISWDLMWNKKL